MGTRLGEVVEGIGQTNVAQQTPYEAIIANTVTAFGQNLFVLIPSVDGGQTTKGPLRWTPLPGPGGSLIYPTKGDLAQVIRTNEGFYWLTAFVPTIWPSVDQLIIKKFSPVGVSSINLGNIDGQNITGIRILGNIVTVGGGTGTVLRLQPNGLNPISQGTMIRRSYWDSTTAFNDAALASNFVNAAGLRVAGTDFSVSSNGVWFDGVFFTSRLAGTTGRKYLGQYANHDYITNNQRHLFADVSSFWNDTTTDITSLLLAIDAGTFSGRITMEVIP